MSRRAAAALAAFLLTTSTATAQWIRLGPEGGSADAVVVDPTNPDVVYAGNTGGVRKSTDGGLTWTDADAGITGTSTWVLGFAIDASAPSTLYAGTTEALFRTTDGGTSWTKLTNGLPPYTGFYGLNSQIAIDPTNPATVYVTTAQKLLKSTNGGAAFTQVGNGATNLNAALLDPATPSTVYAVSGNDPALLKSTDGGLNFSPSSTGLPPGIGTGIIAAAHTSPTTLFVGYYDEGVYRSTDGGASWTASNTGLPAVPMSLSLLSVDPTTPTIAWAATFPGSVYRSTDAGLTWSPTAYPAALGVSTLRTGPGGCVVVGTFGRGIRRSCDGGVTWTGGVAGYRGVAVNGFWTAALAAVPGTPGAFVLAGTDAGLFTTADRGTTWTESTTLPRRSATAVAVSPANPAVIYAFTGAPAARSADGGATWTVCAPVPTSVPGLAMATAADPVDPDTVYVGMYDGSVLKTTDGCASWTPLAVPPLNPVFSVAVDPTNPLRVYVGGIGGLFESEDGGANWTPAPLSAFVGMVHVTSAGTAFAVSQGELYRSTNGGVSWSSVGSGIPADTYPTSLTSDPTRPWRVVASAGEGTPQACGVFLSLDEGLSFTSLTLDLSNPCVTGVALDASGATLLAGSDGESTARLDLLCSTDADCLDTNECTIDTCAPNDPASEANGCVRVQPDPQCINYCDNDADCTYPGELCHLWQCAPGDPAGDERGCIDLGGKPCPGADACNIATCDDATGDCLLLPQTGATCNDGNVCTTVDKCQAGVCVGGGGPLAVCRDSTINGGAALTIKNASPDTKDRLLFKLRKGGLTQLADLGDPFSVGGSGYVACLYDQSSLLQTMQADAGGLCSGRPCWSPAGGGIRYRNKAGSTVGGVDLVELKPGPQGASKFTVRAHGAALSSPVGPLAPTVTLQLRRTNSLSFCVEGTFSAAIRRNDASMFRGKSD